jgi:excisionase family DNA binding protein
MGIGQAAAILGASPASVRRWADQGFLPSYRTPGGQRRFERSDVMRLLERMERRRARAEARESGEQKPLETLDLVS